MGFSVVNVKEIEGEFIGKEPDVAEEFDLE
jgi:hypothetical protein